MTQGSRIESCWLDIGNVTFDMVSQQNFIMDPASAAPRTFACSVGIADIRPAKVRLGLRPSLRRQMDGVFLQILLFARTGDVGPYRFVRTKCVFS